VSADGRGLVSQAGAVLLWETMRVTGLGRGLSQGLARWRAPRAALAAGQETGRGTRHAGTVQSTNRSTDRLREVSKALVGRVGLEPTTDGL
jgi:hypothetical protein